MEDSVRKRFAHIGLINRQGDTDVAPATTAVPEDDDVIKDQGLVLQQPSLEEVMEEATNITLV
jgi:hypothetical protein